MSCNPIETLLTTSMSRKTHSPEIEQLAPGKMMLGRRLFPFGVWQKFLGLFLSNFQGFFIVAGWWFQVILLFPPRSLGKWSNWTSIFLKWVGTTTYFPFYKVGPYQLAPKWLSKRIFHDRNATWLAENHVGLRPTGQDPGGDTQYTTPMPLGVVLGVRETPWKINGWNFGIFLHTRPKMNESPLKMGSFWKENESSSNHQLSGPTINFPGLC